MSLLRVQSYLPPIHTVLALECPRKDSTEPWNPQHPAQVRRVQRVPWYYHHLPLRQVVTQLMLILVQLSAMIRYTLIS